MGNYDEMRDKCVPDGGGAGDGQEIARASGLRAASSATRTRLPSTFSRSLSSPRAAPPLPSLPLRRTASRWFLARKALEGWLQVLLPAGAWLPQYSMVAFSRIPYHEVVARSKRQDELLDRALLAIAAGAAAGAVALGVALARRLRR